MFILYTAFSIIAIILIAALVINKNYEVKKEIDINQPPVVVYDYLRMLKNHLAFNAWILKDPNIQVTPKNMKYPMNFALLFINMDKFLGNDIRKSLENLKTNLEK